MTTLKPTPADQRPLPEFSDTEETFRHLTTSELKGAGRLFSLMGRSWLSNLLSRLGTWAVRWRLPFAEWGVRTTIYRQFVGGTSLENALPTIQRLAKRSVTSILDYGAEAKSEEADFLRFRDEVLKAVRLSGQTEAVDSVVVKVTGLAKDDLLVRYNDVPIDFDEVTDPELANLIERLDTVCRAASEAGIQIYIDAEESWFQGTIDCLADEMMRRYNGSRVVVLNTYQLYRHDRLAFLKASHAKAQASGYPTPIQPNIEATHHDYDAAVEYCIDHAGEIGFLVGTHNERSVRLMTELLTAKGLPRDHGHVNCAQLLGMSDNLTFNLAAAGFNASKYMVYGPVREVLPYLVRRAQENTSVTGEMGRELRLIRTEIQRRKG